MSTLTPYYQGVDLGKCEDYGVYVQDTHVGMARAWLLLKLNKSAPDTQGPPNVALQESEVTSKFTNKPDPKDWTNWDSKGNKVVSYPLRRLSSSFEEWESHLGLRFGSYQVKKYLSNPNSVAESAFSRITISAWCVSLAVVRAAIMHEVYELRLLKKYGYTSTFGQSSGHCHGWTVERVNAFASNTAKFESSEETIVRKSNIELCVYELETIRDALVESGKTDWLYERCRDLYNKIKELNYGYIPGYCKPYVDHGYRKSGYPSIKKLFDEARTRGISFEL
ncbi:hypothetical protein JXM67_02650 [candidate division WOR-3 bacterium]|nr:hypothetical protein [candidate division WOR-3 bacterium]